MRNLILLFALLVAGCNSTDSGDDPGALSGVYQHVVSGQDGDAVVQFQFNSDGTYNGKYFVYLDDGSMECLISEGTGKWAVIGSALKTTQNKTRERSLCEDPFSAWKDDPDSSEEIRNVESDSFELFIQADEESPAQWVKFTKL